MKPFVDYRAQLRPCLQLRLAKGCLQTICSLDHCTGSCQKRSESLSQPAYPHLEVATCRDSSQDSPASKAARKRKWQPRKLSCQRGPAGKSNPGSFSCRACEQGVACTRLHTCRWAQTRRRPHSKPSLDHHKITLKSKP